MILFRNCNGKRESSFSLVCPAAGKSAAILLDDEQNKTLVMREVLLYFMTDIIKS